MGDEKLSIEEEIARESWNEVLPILPHERIWGFLDYTRITIGLAIATWVFLIGGICAQFVDLKTGTAAILAGNSVGVLLASLSTAIASNKYGIEQFTLLRSVFGYRGTLFPLTLSEIIWVGWTAILMAMLGNVALNILRAVMEVPNAVEIWITTSVALLGLIFCWFVLRRGAKSIRELSRFVAPGLGIMMILMVVTILRELSVGELLALEPLDQTRDRWEGFIIAFELNLGAGFGWWCFVGNLARLSKTRRSAFWPNMIGLNLFAVIASVVGLVAGLHFGTSDPTLWMVPLAGAGLGVTMLLFIAFGNITATVSTVYVACVALRQRTLFQHMRWMQLVTIFTVPCAILTLFSGWVYSHFGTLLAITGTLMSPLAGIWIVDFFVLRRQRIDVREIFGTSPSNAYAFWRGVNLLAIASVGLGVGTYFLLFDPFTFANGRAFQSLSASVPAMLVTMCAYYLLARLIVIPSGRGGYVHGD